MIVVKEGMFNPIRIAWAALLVSATLTSAWFLMPNRLKYALLFRVNYRQIIA